MHSLHDLLNGYVLCSKSTICQKSADGPSYVARNFFSADIAAGLMYSKNDALGFGTYENGFSCTFL